MEKLKKKKITQEGLRKDFQNNTGFTKFEDVIDLHVCYHVKKRKYGERL